MKNHLVFLSFFVCTGIYSQNTTINQKGKANRDVANTHKVLIIPFEPKLYMSEIDRNINAETNLSSKEIKFNFRDGINEQIYRAFKTAKYNALDLMGDTLKYKKDLESIYQYLSYEYLPVPDQKNYQVPQRLKEEKKIEKGQINVETHGDMRFMDARINNPKLIPAFQKKYRADLFLFINQLDLKASGNKDPLDLGTGNPNRRITIHYTLMNAEGKELNSGIVEEDFDPALNVPKKIIEKHFSRVASTLVQRTNKALGIPAK